MVFWNLGEVLNITGLAAGAVSTPSAYWSNMKKATALRVYVQASQACEVYFYTNDGTVDDWGNLLGTISGSTGSAYATLVLNPAFLGQSVRFAIKNTGASAGDFKLRASVVGRF